jgi:DNA-binding GntR family transcriptional regulator
LGLLPDQDARVISTHFGRVDDIALEKAFGILYIIIYFLFWESNWVAKGNRMTRLTASEKIFQELRDRILRLKLFPGFHLTEKPLAREFGVSGTPVREALHRLVESGLAKRETARGVTVYRPDSDDVSHVCQLRALLEPAALRDSVSIFKPSDWRKIEDILKEAERGIEIGDVIGLSQLNDMFHRQLYSRSPNKIMVDILNGLVDRHRLISIHFCTVYTLWVDDWNDHRNIFEKAQKGDVDEAAELLTMHITQFQYKSMMTLDDRKGRRTETVS